MTSLLTRVAATDLVPAILAPTAADVDLPADAKARAAAGTATPFTVDLERMVAYGHVAPWDRCIFAPRGAGCWMPPKDDDLSSSMQGEMELADGSRIACGVIPFQTNHAATHLTGPQAVDAMANTGVAFARVRYGKDRVGIYAAGPILPGVTYGDVVRVMAAAQSGDWRSLWPWMENEGRFRFTGSIAVNLPALPMDRSIDVAETHRRFAVAASAPCDWTARTITVGTRQFMEVSMVAAAPKKTGTGSRQLDRDEVKPPAASPRPTLGGDRAQELNPPKAPPAPTLPGDRAHEIAAKTKPAPAKPKTPVSSPSGHTVKKGDTLTALAQKLLGDAKRWRELYDANKDLIGKNPNLIKPGQKLKLPGAAKPAEKAPAAGAPAATDWAAQQKAVTADARTKREAIYAQFKSQFDALKTDTSPNKGEKRTQLYAQRSGQLKALRDETAAKRQQIRDKRAASKKTTGRTSAMDDITTPAAEAEATVEAVMPQPGQTVTLDDGTTGVVLMIGDDHGDPVVILDDGRTIQADEIATTDEAAPAAVSAAVSAAAHACSCGAKTAAPDPAAGIDAGMGDPGADPGMDSGATDTAAGIQAILARLDGIDAKLDAIDGYAAMAALPAEAARIAAIDDELADMDAHVASLVITVEEAPQFRHDDIVSLPDGSTGWVTYGEPTQALGGELMVRVCTDIGAREDCAANTVLVPVSQLQATGQVREREWVDDDAAIVITATPPSTPTPTPEMADA